MIDFVGATKPYHTKIFDTGVKLSFRDEVVAVLSDTLHLVVESTFNTHRGVCEPDVQPCIDEGFEVNVWDDSLGFEPTRHFSIVKTPTPFPTHQVSVLGEPLFYEIDPCDPENLVPNRRFRETSVVTLSVEPITKRVRISLLKPSLLRDADDITFTTTETTIASPPLPIIVELFGNVAGKTYTLRRVSPPTNANEMSWFHDTYELQEQATGAYLLSTTVTVLPLPTTGYDIRVRDAYSQICPDGFEANPYEVVRYEGVSEDCVSNCDGVFVGSVPPPDCSSPTTVTTSLCETLVVTDSISGALTIVVAPPTV